MPLGRRLLSWIGALLAVALLSGPAQAAPTDWSFSSDYSSVGGDNRAFGYQPPGTVTGQQAAHRLAVRVPRRNAPGKATVALQRTFTATLADKARVDYFGRAREVAFDPLGKIAIYVRCVSEVEGSTWEFLGKQDIMPNTTPQTLEKPIDQEACPTLTVDGMMIQVRGADEPEDHRWRTAFLTRAQVFNGGTAAVDDNFQAP